MNILSALYCAKLVLEDWGRDPEAFPLDVVAGRNFATHGTALSREETRLCRAVMTEFIQNRRQIEWWLDFCGLETNLRNGLLFAGSSAQIFDPLGLPPARDKEHLVFKLKDTERQAIKKFAKYFKNGTLDHREQDDATRANLPDFIWSALLQGRDTKSALNLARDLQARPPTVLRANTIKISQDQLLFQLAEKNIPGKKTQFSPWGIRIADKASFHENSMNGLYNGGGFEIQDESSQISALLSMAQPGEKVIDFCAGNGESTLTLASMMQNSGQLVATDVRTTQLDSIAIRAKRSGAFNVDRMRFDYDQILANYRGKFDLVFVDAPSSNLGKLRQRVELKWQIKPERLETYHKLQTRALFAAAQLVRRGGRLLYIVQSPLQSEGRHQVEKFLSRHGEFNVVAPKLLWQRIAGNLAGYFDGPMLKLGPYIADMDELSIGFLVKNG